MSSFVLYIGHTYPWYAFVQTVLVTRFLNVIFKEHLTKVQTTKGKELLLIVCCLTHSGIYVLHIQDNKIFKYNIYILYKYYIGLREEEDNLDTTSSDCHIVKHGELDRAKKAATMPNTFCLEICKSGLQRARSLAFCKHDTNYGLRSCILYHNLTSTCRVVYGISPLIRRQWFIIQIHVCTMQIW
jgi:hypothetical protein